MVPVIVTNLAEGLAKEVKALAVDQVVMALCAEKECKRLQTTMTTILAVLSDAEEEQNENSQVHDWLSKLQDAICDAVDVVDDFSSQVLKLELHEAHSDFKSYQVVCFLPKLKFKCWLSYKIKGIRKTMNDISDDRQCHYLRTEVPKPKTWVLTEAVESHSVASLGLVGRQTEQDDVVDILLDNGRDVKLSCHAIVGIGGLGKTSLAKLVYNDRRIESHFPKRIWVHVSPDFSLKRIIRCIVVGIMEENSSEQVLENAALEDLQKKLLEKIDGERILVVLDDVWLESPTHDQWRELKDLLTVSAAGSKILMTARNQSIAKIVGAENVYNLHGLSDDDCWYLLAKTAFGSGDHATQDMMRYPNLVAIGKEIAKKDEGVPLVVATLGGMLSGNTDEAEWLHVQREDLWKMHEGADQVMRILGLSFSHLPSNAKVCFIYCCIYLKRHQMDKETLKQMWIAQGFIHPSDGLTAWDVADKCFDLLVSRSLFQDVEDDDFNQSAVCRMHDLLHDFASFTSKNNTAIINLDDEEECSEPVPDSVRHISFLEPSRKVPKYYPTSILKLKRLSTLLWAPISESNRRSRFPLHLFTDSFRTLRVLDLSGLQVEALPPSIGDQTHLRYLSLTGNRAILHLPGSITKLYQLETLRLNKCSNIQHLPDRLEDLPKLHHLYITSKQKDLTFLKSIRFASAFRTLFIDDCEYLELIPISSESFKHVQKLRLSNCPRVKITSNAMAGMVSLKQVTLARLPTLIFIPRSLKCAASTLRTMYVAECQALIELPEWLAECRFLRRLTLIDCPKLKSLPEGLERLYGLKVVTIRGCPGLKNRCRREVGEEWHKIAHVEEVYVD